MPRRSSGKQLANEQLMEKWWNTFPPSAPLNATVKRQEFIKLNSVLLKHGYTHEEISDAIDYARMKGKRYKTIGSIAFLIEESIQYQKKLTELHASKQGIELDWDSTTPANVSTTKSIPTWLNLNTFGEVE